MTRYKIKNLKILCCCLSVWFVIYAALVQLVHGSEFPERECCDLTTTSTLSPLPIPPAAAMPTDKTLSATQTAIQTISVGRSGSNIKVASAILNCILARQLCFEDPSCSAILEIIPRVCGPIPVSCSTVTVTKCQAALRTLQAFQFFRPTCLCKEPGMDPDCNHFRDFLFDHPCGFVLKKAEKDPYPIDALPTCNHALSVCQQERKCLKLFEDFKTHCKVRDNKCKMESRDACHDSWTNLRLSPMFGCICPNNHMKKRCDRIFNIVNHNPCVDRLIFFPNGLTPKLKQRLRQKQPKKQRKKQQKLSQTYRNLNNTVINNNNKYHGQHGQHQQHNSYNGEHQHQHQHQQLNNNDVENDESSPYHRKRLKPYDEKENVDAENHDNSDTDDDNNNTGANKAYDGSKDKNDNSNDNEDEEDYDDYDDQIRAEIYSNYPHYLHPPSWGLNNPLVLASHSPHTYDDDVVIEMGGEIDSAHTVSTLIKHHKNEEFGEVEEEQEQQHEQTTWPHYRTQHDPLNDFKHHQVDDVVVVVDTGTRSRKNGGITVGLGTITTTGLAKNKMQDMHRQTYYTRDNDDDFYQRYHQTKQQQQQQQQQQFGDIVVVGVTTLANPTTVTTTNTTNATATLQSANKQKPQQQQQHKIATPTTTILSTKMHKFSIKDDITTGSDILNQRNSNSNSNRKSNGGSYDSLSMDERVKVMGMDEKLHQKIFEDNLALIDTPLIVTTSSIHYPGMVDNLNNNNNNNNNGHYHILQGVVTYPFNMSEFHQRHVATNDSPLDIIDTGGQDLEVDLSTDIIKQHFQSTCHTALDTCREDPSCLSSLQPMLMHCEMPRCNRNACMTSLQSFYKGPHEDINLDVAFCLCKKTANRQDACMIAQEKLHPVCAQRPPENPQQQQTYTPPPSCHAVAEACKEDRECRLKLEYYEQACAVDSVTKKCAGRPSGCRTAMIGILGTMLRTTCACQGTDAQYLYQCVGWRRLLWMNPCVVEAQKDFHMKRLAEMGFLTTTSTTTTTTTTTTIAPLIPSTLTIPATTINRAAAPNKNGRKSSSHVFLPKEKSEPTSVEHNYIEQPLHSGNDENGNSGNDDYHSNNNNNNNKNKNKNNGNNGNGNGNNFNNGLGGSRHTKTGRNSKHSYNAAAAAAANGASAASSATLDTVNGNARGNGIISSNSAGGTHNVVVNGNNLNGNGGGGENGDSIGGGGSVIVDFDDQLIYVEAVDTTEFAATDATIAIITTPTTTTTTTVATTTQAPRNCVAQRPHQSDQLIREGTSKRIYSLDDAECSELCSCGESLTLTCHALCVPFAPCRTALAFYSHASPAYQAFRGRCLCYSGRFICMKPPLGDYSLPGGVFLMLGYSSADEALLRPHTNLGVQDAVRALQQYVTSYIDNQTQCTLTLFNMTDENIIIAARLPHDAKLKSIELLRKEKEECTTILKTITHHINSEHHELQSHRLLSIFKMAEVEVVWPETNQTVNVYNNSMTMHCIIIVLIALLLTQLIIPVNCLAQQQQQQQQQQQRLHKSKWHMHKQQQTQQQEQRKQIQQQVSKQHFPTTSTT